MHDFEQTADGPADSHNVLLSLSRKSHADDACIWESWAGSSWLADKLYTCIAVDGTGQGSPLTMYDVMISK